MRWIPIALACWIAGACVCGATVGSGLGAPPGATSCSAPGGGCDAGADCCEGSCLDGICCPSAGPGCSGGCGAGESCVCGGCCPGAGSACVPDADRCCAGLSCEGRDGGAACCANEGAVCAAPSDCCSGLCEADECVCAGADGGCAADPDCCSGSCQGGWCS